jgi:hypothetical protein
MVFHVEENTLEFPLGESDVEFAFKGARVDEGEWTLLGTLPAIGAGEEPEEPLRVDLDSDGRAALSDLLSEKAFTFVTRSEASFDTAQSGQRPIGQLRLRLDLELELETR